MDELEPAFKKWCENEGVRWRRALKLYAYDPLPAHRLADHLGIQVMSPAEIPGVEAQTLQQLLMKDTASWSATALPLPDDHYLIIYNPTHSPARHESNIMHELAHLILKHKPIRFTTLPGASLPIREYHEGDEQAASYLSGCFLITMRGLDWAIQRKMTQEQIAAHFGASLEMVRYRCNMTGRSTG